VPPLPVRRARQLARAGHGGTAASGNITMSETSLGPRRPAGRRSLGARAAQDPRRAGAGQGLIGPLLKACLDRGIEPRTGMRAVELLQDGRRIAGVRFETASGSGVPVEVGAAGGVVIATGGFEWDPELVRAFSRGPPGALRVRPDQYRRRPEMGDARRRRDSATCAGVVGGHYRRHCGRPASRLAGQRRAHTVRTASW